MPELQPYYVLTIQTYESHIGYEPRWTQAAGKKGFGVGMVEDEQAIVKCGLPCCTLGLIKPSVCSASTGECLCIKSAASFPFKEGFVPSLMCTICFFSIIGPNTGCMAEPPAFDAPGGKPVADMER